MALINPQLLGIIQISPAIILIIYGWVKQKKYRDYFDILLMTLPATLLYGILIGINPGGDLQSYFYFLVKLVLFVLPGFLIIKWRKHKLSDFGITNKKLKLSILLGFGVLVITSITNAIIFSQMGNPIILDLYTIITWSIPLFFDAFNEEFLFRGVFFLFAYKKTKNLFLSFTVSTIITIAWHPLELWRAVPAVIQGSLLCYLLYRSENIHGAWMSHGINRSLANFLIQIFKT